MAAEFLIGVTIAASAFLTINGINTLPMLLLLMFAYTIYNLVDKGNFIKSRAKVVNGEYKITFEQIGGQAVAKNELLEALEFVKNQEKARKMESDHLRHTFDRSPRNGKNSHGKSSVSYIDSVFISASGSEFIEMYAGVGAQRVRQLFENARNLASKASKKHGVVFIDEIEVIAGTRGKNVGHMEYDQTLNQLLVEMDGISSQDDVNILVIAATNRPDILDPAILRPGRFDRIVKVDLPCKEGRLEILKLHTKDKPIAQDVDLDKIAGETFGFSGAHLENLCNEAAILALRKGDSSISHSCFIEAIDKVMMGEKLNRKPTREERKRIAIHESGHALISEYFNPESVSTITITSRGQALGYVRQRSEDDMYLYTKDYMESQIAVALAGATAEEAFLGSKSTGAASDFEHAIKITKKMIFSGMSDLGIIDKETVPAETLHKVIQDILREQKI